MARTASARPASTAVFDACRRLTARPAFDRAIVVVILFNAAVLGAGTYDSVARRHGDLLDLLNEMCLAVFVVELVIRFLAAVANPRRYLSSGWNVFDFVVVGAAFVPGLGTNSTLLRLARLLSRSAPPARPACACRGRRARAAGRREPRRAHRATPVRLRDGRLADLRRGGPRPLRDDRRRDAQRVRHAHAREPAREPRWGAKCRSGRSSTSSRSPCSRGSCCSTCSSASSS